jgi:hypothetical protein
MIVPSGKWHVKPNQISGCRSGRRVVMQVFHSNGLSAGWRRGRPWGLCRGRPGTILIKSQIPILVDRKIIQSPGSIWFPNHDQKFRGNDEPMFAFPPLNNSGG